MNPSTTALTLNMQLPNIATVAWAVQGDQLSRFVECTLVDGSTAWNPQTGYHGVIRAHKPDGTACVYDVDEDGNPAVTWTGNVATVTIAQQAVTVAGTVLMQLEFYDSNNARITAFAWAMNVQPSAVTDTEFLSSDYYNILTLQIAAVLGSSGHPPYIDPTTKNWMIWDEDVGDYADSGYSSVGETGPQGPTGPQGVSIVSTSKASGTGAPGTTDVYNVNLSSGSVAGQFNVYNGSDGAGSPGSQLPLMDGVASVGTAIAYSREDHVHPQDSELKTVAKKALTGKRAYIIGDSLNERNGGFGQYVLSISGMVGQSVGNGSSGFVQVGTDNKKFIDLLNDLSASLTTAEKNDTDYFVLMGGINDAYNGITASQEKTAVETFIATAKTVFPNAEIIICPLHTFKWMTQTQYNCYAQIIDTCREKGIRTTEDFIWWSIVDDYGIDSGDRVHLTSTGCQILGGLIVNFIMGSSPLRTWSYDMETSVGTMFQYVVTRQGRSFNANVVITGLTVINITNSTVIAQTTTASTKKGMSDTNANVATGMLYNTGTSYPMAFGISSNDSTNGGLKFNGFPQNGQTITATGMAVFLNSSWKIGILSSPHW